MKTPLSPRVLAVKAHDDYTLDLSFTDGSLRRFDVSPLLDFGVFKELKDPVYFKSVRVQGGTVQWPHEQDICPDTLYIDGKLIRKNGPTGQGRRKPLGSSSIADRMRRKFGRSGVSK